MHKEKKNKIGKVQYNPETKEYQREERKVGKLDHSFLKFFEGSGKQSTKRKKKTSRKNVASVLETQTEVFFFI